MSDIPSDTSSDVSVKINVIGSGGTGKTRYVITAGDEFVKKGQQVENLTPWTEDLVSTVGGFFINLKDYHVEANKTKTPISFAIWDLGGQLRYSDVRKIYLEGTSGIMAVIDLARAYSLEVLEKAIMKKEVKKTCEDIPIVLVGNKSDLRKTIQEKKGEMAAVIATMVEQIVAEKKTVYNVEIRIGSEKGSKTFSEPLESFGDQPSLRVADFEASVYYTLQKHFKELPFTEMNLKLIARELWFTITDKIFNETMGGNIPYNLIERASLGVPLFREYMRSPEILVPVNFSKAEYEKLLEKLLVSTTQLEGLAQRLRDEGFNIIEVAEVSAVENMNIMKPFETILNGAAQFALTKGIKDQKKKQETGLKEGFDQF